MKPHNPIDHVDSCRADKRLGCAEFLTNQSLLCRTFLRFLAISEMRPWPDALKIVPTERIPPNLCEATAARPMDAMHPQDAQSGLPPNWHGVIFVRRSADNVWVVSAKTQSCGLCGGEANCRISPARMSSFEYCFRNSIMSAMACARSSALKISGIRSPT